MNGVTAGYRIIHLVLVSWLISDVSKIITVRLNLLFLNYWNLARVTTALWYCQSTLSAWTKDSKLCIFADSTQLEITIVVCRGKGVNWLSSWLQSIVRLKIWLLLLLSDYRLASFKRVS